MILLRQNAPPKPVHKHRYRFVGLLSLMIEASSGKIAGNRQMSGHDEGER